MPKQENDDVVLVCAYADSPFVVPGSIFDKVCGKCGRQLMIAPSGQSIMKQHPAITLLCQECFQPNGTFEIAPETSIVEIIREISTARPNWRRYRN